MGVLFWCIVLLEMVNLVVKSVWGGGGVNLIRGIIGGIVFRMIVVLFELIIKAWKDERKEEE